MFYKRIIHQRGGQALELGCSAGRLLLAYLQDGLEVEGVDISGDQLAMCFLAAKVAGVQPVLYEQAMQGLDLPQRYSTIYIPCGSFVCVMDRMEALETLRRCYAHLVPGGMLVFNVYLPDYDYSGQTEPGPFPQPWQKKAEKQLPGDRRLVVYYRETGLDPVKQIWMEERRYELYKGQRLVSEEIHSGQGRLYFCNELLWMLQLAGFAEVVVKGDYTNEDFNAEHNQTMVFMATKAAAA